MTKSIFFTFATFILFSFTEPTETVNWISLAEAQEKIKHEPKTIFIDFSPICEADEENMGHIG